MRVSQGAYLHGLRLEDSEGEVIVEKIWSNAAHGAWEKRTVHDGEHIVGMKCHTGGAHGHIPRIGFLTARAPIRIEPKVEENKTS